LRFEADVESASPAPARLVEFWRSAGATLLRDAQAPLPARIARLALALTGASAVSVYLRDRQGWSLAAAEGAEASLEPPDPWPTAVTRLSRALWVPLETEGEIHGYLALRDAEEEESFDFGAFLGFFCGALAGASRLSRMVKDAEFELKARLLELESLYDLGLSLAGQLDLPALADEVLFRSISLTDARKGTLVLLGEDGTPILSRNVGDELLAEADVLSWALPEGEVAINNEAAAVPTAGVRLASCQKCLAVAISVPGRRLGVLAVADKESRDGRVLDFQTSDARLLSLFANQAAAAIETARLHREGIEKERIEKELELAAAIQREILPRSLPEVPGVELAAANLPTRQVGGDYFDLFPLSRGRLGFLVADVSGKGIPAALLVSTVHAAVHLLIDEAKTVGELVSRIDRHLQRYAAVRKFLTLFFGLLEPDSGLLRYVSAGHNPALVVGASGTIRRVESTGVPLGMFPSASWREETLELAPGDLLAVYTDGLTEAVNEADEEFGLERLASRLVEHAGLEASQLCDRVFSAVADFAGRLPQYDDQTLLLVRRKA
jgi:sigma-B regulation protein RsbU (phosphoserine phosphatase)